MDPERKGGITELEFLVQRLFVTTEAFSLKGNYVCNEISTSFVTPEKQNQLKLCLETDLLLKYSEVLGLLTFQS